MTLITSEIVLVYVGDVLKLLVLTEEELMMRAIDCWMSIQIKQDSKLESKCPRSMDWITLNYHVNNLDDMVDNSIWTECWTIWT